MAIRHNTCTNPALGVNATGWSPAGAVAPTRFDVTTESFGRQWAARYPTAAGGSFGQSATGAVVGSQTYTVSAYIQPDGVGTGSNACYIEWRNAGGSASYTSSSYNFTGSAISRITITGAAPADAVTASLIFDLPSGRTSDITMALIEQANAVDTYFDGDSPSATWDGTPGNSASTIGAVAAPVPFQGWGVPI
ncbi:MAG: hypothetical protein JWL97_3504 [Gemmatimonadales bacterium]|nr:hypothetical protein [Gemmatimonadales bacterium]